MGKRGDVGQIRDVVDSAIDSNDILPLVRLVFEGCVETVGSPTSNTSDQVATADIVTACLESMVDDESDVAAQICKGNTGTIVESMDELEGVQVSAEQLRQDLMGVNADLQNAGEALMHRLNDFGDLQEVEDRLLATGSALEWTCAVLERCSIACQHIEHHRLHQALKVLEDIQSNMILANAEESSKPLKDFLGKVSSDLVGIVQKLAMSDFNDWLVSARAEARHIGLQAIRRAAIWRQHEETCALERNKILQAIKSGSDLHQAASLRVPALAIVETLSESATRQTHQSMDITAGHDGMSGPLSLTLEDDHWEVASSVVLSETGRGSMSAHRSVASIIPERHGMNMRGLHRCIHVHEKMGRMSNFREYYMQQRRMQMDSDLRPPANFLEVYQTYLAQVTGFFIIEDNVQRMASNLLEQEEVEALWEMATATLKSVVDNAFESMSSAAAMLLVKDFLLLVCGALSKSGYPAANLKDILSSNMSKYHGLMNGHVAGEVSRIWEADELERVKIKSEKIEQEVITDLGLPASLDGWKPSSQLPYRAAFTSMVPQILWLVQEYVRDSVAYLKGLTNLGDVLPAACANRDKIIKAAVDVLQAKLQGVTVESSMLKQSMQFVTNMWALAYGFAQLEDWTASQVLRGGTSEQKAKRHRKAKSSKNSVSGSHILSISRAAEDSAESLLLRIVSAKIGELLGELKTWEWTPKAPPPAATSPVIEELMIYLQGVFDLSMGAMPKHNAEIVMTSSIQLVGSSLTHVLAGDSPTVINDYGFQRLLGDVTALERFADKSSVQGLGSDLAQCREICSLIVDGKLDDAVDPQRLKQKYRNVDVNVLVTVLDKFRDVGSGMSNFLGSRLNRVQPRRKAVEAVAKQLRDKLFAHRTSLD